MLCHSITVRKVKISPNFIYCKRGADKQLDRFGPVRIGLVKVSWTEK